MSPTSKFWTPAPVTVALESVATYPIVILVFSLPTVSKVYSVTSGSNPGTVVPSTVKSSRVASCAAASLVTVTVYVFLVHVFPGTLSYSDLQFSGVTSTETVFSPSLKFTEPVPVTVALVSVGVALTVVDVVEFGTVAV